MRIVDALIEVLKDGEPLTYKEAYKKIIEKKLYSFGAKDPEAAVNAKLRCHCDGLEFPGASPVKYFKIIGQQGKRNLYGLLKEHEEQTGTKKKNNNVKSSDDDMLPEEKIDLTYLFYKSKLKKQILNRIMECHPSFFEQLVVCKINNYTYISHYVILNTPKFTEVFRDGKINTISAFRRRS